MQDTESKPSEITLGGRAFRVIDFDRRTIPLHFYLETEMRASGLDACIPGAEEDDDAWGVRLRTQLVDSGRAIDMVAGYIVPADKTERDWTPAMAAETADHLRQCAAAEDMETFDQLALTVALRFFMHAVERWNRFQNSSPRAPATPNPVLH